MSEDTLEIIFILFLLDTFILQYDDQGSVSMSHNYFLLILGTIKIYSLSKFNVYNTVLLATIT